MKCNNCGETISVSNEATVSEARVGGEDSIDLQIRCPKCKTNHFTFISISDLTVDKG